MLCILLSWPTLRSTRTLDRVQVIFCLSASFSPNLSTNDSRHIRVDEDQSVSFGMHMAKSGYYQARHVTLLRNPFLKCENTADGPRELITASPISSSLCSLCPQALHDSRKELHIFYAHVLCHPQSVCSTSSFAVSKTNDTVSSCPTLFHLTLSTLTLRYISLHISNDSL